MYIIQIYYSLFRTENSGCRLKSNCHTRGSGIIGGMPFLGVFLRDPISKKTAKIPNGQVEKKKDWELNPAPPSTSFERRTARPLAGPYPYTALNTMQSTYLIEIDKSMFTIKMVNIILAFCVQGHTNNLGYIMCYGGKCLKAQFELSYKYFLPHSIKVQCIL